MRIFHDAITQSSIEQLEENIKKNPENFALFDATMTIKRAGFRDNQPLFKVGPKEYYVTEFFEIDSKTLPSYYTEMYYFKNVGNLSDSEEKVYPILIKILLNRKKRILCLYSKQVLRNAVVDNLIINLRNKYSFDFRIKPEQYIFKKNQLEGLVNALDIKDYTAISVWDKDNKAILTNPEKLSETEKFISFLNDRFKGKWDSLKVPFDDLDIELRINNRTQNRITFSNDYIDDDHLINAVDFIVSKIFEVEDFSGPKQMYLNSFKK